MESEPPVEKTDAEPSEPPSRTDHTFHYQMLGLLSRKIPIESIVLEGQMLQEKNDPKDKVSQRALCSKMQRCPIDKVP